jgi:hypothetical protein
LEHFNATVLSAITLLHRLLEKGAYRFSFFLDFEVTVAIREDEEWITLDLQSVARFENALKLREADLEKIENRVDELNGTRTGCL